ncbi:MAG: ABC transporter ATP-binding protein [Lachnospiraceae bacterium]|nr:ABC transporter ATP-binding protein [Lachnospiraceae bacterium]
MKSEKYIIEVVNAVKKYKETIAVNDVSLNFERNKITGIIGRNGSGKTVLLKCICGLTKLSSGKIMVDGKIIGRDIETPKSIGVIIETPGFIQEFSGLKNLEILYMMNNKKDKEKLKEVMRTVGLNPDDKKRVSKYSLGMKQRLGIAQAIMENPDILILDEPTNALDKHGVDEFRQLLLKLKGEGKTIIIASHNSADIELLCDTVYELDGGKII